MFKATITFVSPIVRRNRLDSQNKVDIFILLALSCAWFSMPAGAAPTLSNQNKVDGEVRSGTANDAAQNAAGYILISELRTQGPNGARDSFVELANTSAQKVEISGWSLNFEAADGAFKIQIPHGISIPAYGHFLLAGAQYSLAREYSCRFKNRTVFHRWRSTTRCTKSPHRCRWPATRQQCVSGRRRFG